MLEQVWFGLFRFGMALKILVRVCLVRLGLVRLG